MRTFILFYNDSDLSVFCAVAGICLDRIAAFHDTILQPHVISQINVVKNHRIPDHTVVADIDILEQYRILDRTINNASTRNKTILYDRSRIIFCRWQIVDLCLDRRFLSEKVIPDLRLQKCHIGSIICLCSRNLSYSRKFV